MIDTQSTSGNNMVNLYNSRLKDSNLDEKISDTHRKLDQWREDCHKTIDELYQRKLDEFNSYINELKTKYEEKKTRVQTNISRLNNDQNKDSIKTMIDSIERDLNDIEQTSLQIHTRSLNINDNYIYMEKEFGLRYPLIDSSKFLYSSESSSAIASNERVLLMHHHPYLNLIDQDLKIIKQKIWFYGWIRDMCWSKTLLCFIVITSTNIYLVDEQLQSCSPKEEETNSNWFSCTCSDEYLYLSTCQWGSAIFQLSLLSPIDFVQQWTSPLTCQAYEGINDIKYNNGQLALMINDSKEHQKRMDLKSSQTFSTIWSLPLSVGTGIRLFTCCPFNSDQWIIIDGTNSQIYQVTKDGKLRNNIQYPSVPYRANLFNSNVLAIAAEHDLTLCQI